MIRSAAARLALYYLAIIMALSIGFSWVVYRISDHEITNGLRRPAFLSNHMVRPAIYDRFTQDRLYEAHNNLRVDLVAFNSFVLIAGGALSYMLARRTLQPIEDALDRQSRFTADASHELRTPLTAMQTEIEVALRDSKLSIGPARQLLTSNLEEINKLRDLSEALLKLARDDGKSLNLHRESLDQISDQAIKRVKMVAKAKNISLVSEVKPQLVRCDRTAIIEALTILLDNAIKFSPEGSQIRLSSQQSAAHISLLVQDHGIGIDAKDLPHIFERFYRQDQSRSNKAKSGGYGLGLAIAMRLVNLHHGNITAKSQPGKGSTFAIILPKQVQ